MSGLWWFAMGVCVGVLGLMQLQVVASWRWRRKHPMMYDIRRPGPPAEWVDEP